MLGDGREKLVRRLLEGGQRVGIKHNCPLRGQRGADLRPGILAYSHSWTQQDGVAAWIGEKGFDCQGCVDLGQKDRGQMSSICSQGRSGRGERHKACPNALGRHGGEPCRTGVPRAAGEDDGMARRELVARRRASRQVP